MKKLLAIALLVISVHAEAQDIHFSQFSRAPLMINPGNTGVMMGDLRFGLNYRSRWGDFGNGFRTYAFSYDQPAAKKGNDDAYMGIGFSVFKDAAGDVELSNTKAMLSLSAIIKLERNQELSIGIQGGVAQRSLNAAAFMWDDQFDGIRYNEDIVSQDNFAFAPYVNTDVGAGVTYTFYAGKRNMTSYDEVKMKIGVAGHHLNRPFLRYFSDDDRQMRKVVAHGEFFFGQTNAGGAVVPSFYVALQGPSQDIMAGLHYRVRLTEGSRNTGFQRESAWAFGFHYRYRDAFIPSIFIDLKNLSFGLSYDINVSKIQTAQQTQGGLELSLRYVRPANRHHRRGRRRYQL